MDSVIADGAAVMHRVADTQNDSYDHDEYHAAGAVMVLLAGEQISATERNYIMRWLHGLNGRI